MFFVCKSEFLKGSVLVFYCFRSMPARYLMLFDCFFHLCMRTLMILSCIFHFAPIVLTIRPLPLLQWNTASATLGLGCITISLSLTMKTLNSYSLVHVNNKLTFLLTGLRLDLRMFLRLAKPETLVCGKAYNIYSHQ